MPEKSGEFSVVNIEGKQLFKTSFKGSFTMNARKLGRGAYVAVVKTDGGSFISKVINLTNRTDSGLVVFPSYRKMRFKNAGLPGMAKIFLIIQKWNENRKNRKPEGALNPH
jgi:hypothetical protein